MPLPCKHAEEITEQVPPTIHLLRNLDTLHPDILLQHKIHPEDYNGNLVFRSAVESIRGTYISSSTTSRQGLIQRVLARMKIGGLIADFQETSNKSRYDFQVTVAQNPDYFASIEVKGGEGNSINISKRPLWAKEFAVWCHLDGAIVNQPAHGAGAIVNRLMRELVIEAKQVDALFIRDVICGTDLRPCPKYPEREDVVGDDTAPDVFLLPQRRPTLNDPEPPAHTLDTLRLPGLILKQFGIEGDKLPRHVWQVGVRVEEVSAGTFRRMTSVHHMGQVVMQRTSRSWRE